MGLEFKGKVIAFDIKLDAIFISMAFRAKIISTKEII